jgi:hypothetical protein
MLTVVCDDSPSLSAAKLIDQPAPHFPIAAIKGSVTKTTHSTSLIDAENMTRKREWRNLDGVN